MRNVWNIWGEKAHENQNKRYYHFTLGLPFVIGFLVTLGYSNHTHLSYFFITLCGGFLLGQDVQEYLPVGLLIHPLFHRVSSPPCSPRCCASSNMYLALCRSKPLQIWDKKVRNGHIKRITDQDIQSSVLEIVGTWIPSFSYSITYMKRAGVLFLHSMQCAHVTRTRYICRFRAGCTST